MNRPKFEHPQQARRALDVTGVPLVEHRGLDSAADLKLTRWRGAFEEAEVRPSDDFHGLTLVTAGAVHRLDRPAPVRRKGALTLRPCGAEGVFRTEGETEYVRLYLRASALTGIAETILDRSAADANFPEVEFVADPVLISMLNACVSALGARKDVSRLELDGWAQVIGARILEAYGSGNPVSTSAPAAFSRGGLSNALELIDSALGEDLSIGVLAAEVGMSPTHFARAFKQAMGATPHQYVLERRIARARELLASPDLSIAEIAYQVGFSSQAHLTDAFRKRLNTTPGRCRREMGVKVIL